MRKRIVFCSLLAVLVSNAATGNAAERPMMQPRVPADNLADARALTNPLPDSPEIVEKGKALYNGRGTCFNCHGKDGSGNGMAAVGLDPSPRNFQHHGFWRHRTEGEIFWVIKHGSPGTAMIGFGDQLTDEEIWSIIQYERSFAAEHGHGMMGHGQGMGPMMGPGGGMGGMEHRGPKGGMGCYDGQPCEKHEESR
ncbi:c-type cytochrome [Nitrospira sp. NS4]|uniref:c-type cytochrome n=1 Tax=Nitrospira sp. NS4 TaxID=3414498 RepID=UPI003C2B8285